DQVETGLGMPHDLTNADRGGRTAKTDSAAAAPHGVEEALLAKVVHHFHQMVVRNAVGAGDLTDRCQPVGFGGEVHQDPERIVSVAFEPHSAGHPKKSEQIHVCVLHD